MAPNHDKPPTTDDIREMIADALKTIQNDVHGISIQVSQIQTSLNKVDKFITGNGDPEKGAIIRLDRLEQEAKTRGKWVGVVGTGAILALIGTLWNIITKHHG